VHFDLCNSSGVTNQFFGQIGAGVAIGYAHQLSDCSALDNGPFGSKLGTLKGGEANAGGVLASGALPGAGLGDIPISASGPEPSLSLSSLEQFKRQSRGQEGAAAPKAAAPVAGKQEAHVVAAGAQSTTMSSVVSSSAAVSSSSSTGNGNVGGAVAASSSTGGTPAAQSTTLVAVVSGNIVPGSSSASPSPSSSGIAPSGLPGQSDDDDGNEQDDCDEL